MRNRLQRKVYCYFFEYYRLEMMLEIGGNLSFKQPNSENIQVEGIILF